MLELCRFFKTGRPDPASIKGLSFFGKNGKIRHTENRPQIEKIDALPVPERRLSVLSSRLELMDTENLIASRGCPYRCTFCSSRLFWDKKVRMRSAENILAEIESLKAASGIRHFIFLDDSFTPARGDRKILPHPHPGKDGHLLEHHDPGGSAG